MFIVALSYSLAIVDKHTHTHEDDDIVQYHGQFSVPAEQLVTVKAAASFFTFDYFLLAPVSFFRSFAATPLSHTLFPRTVFCISLLGL